MAKALDQDIVAEGVETEDHEQFLKSAGVERLQGYLFARPMPADQFLAYLTRAPG